METPLGLQLELKAIRDALLKLDAQLLDEDKPDFYTFILNELYGQKGDYANPSFTPKENFKVLLKEIKTIVEYRG